MNMGDESAQVDIDNHTISFTEVEIVVHIINTQMSNSFLG